MFTEKYTEDNNEHKGFYARSGRLKTRHGTLKTPFFMPVATKAAQKHLSSSELEECGTEAIISNSFILSLKPGVDVVREAGGIHKYMNYHKGIFTDSGGFQMLLSSFNPKVTEQGVTFRNPFDGQKLMYTPEKVMDVEQDIGSDVAMVLDHVLHHDQTHASLKDSMERTYRWAKRAKEYHSDDKQLLFGITQGGTYHDLRVESARLTNSLDFDGIALGGLCIGETQESMFSAIRASLPELDPAKPRYLMGVGTPIDIVKGVAHGVDVFDSTFPAQNARHNTAFTSKGKIRINKGQYKKDFTPLDEECDCYVCKNFTRSYLHHLMRQEEPVGLRYMTYHNIYYMQHLMKDIRKAIQKGYFHDLQKEIEQLYSGDKEKTYRKIE